MMWISGMNKPDHHTINRFRSERLKKVLEEIFTQIVELLIEAGQLKAGYNLQISSSNQYIVNYSLHQKPTDTTTLSVHIESYKEKYGTVPEVIVADAGYGSEENYEYLENQKIEGYVKYNYFDKEQKKSKKDKKPFAAEKLYYNKEEDSYYCPMGQQMKKIGERERRSENRYSKTISIYQAINCKGNPVRGVCHNQKGNRIISVSHRGNYLRKKAKEKLETEEGIKYRKKRPVEAEPVFGNIKQNKKFKRFYLRGLHKVKTELGLIAIAHNLAKLAIAT